MRKKHKNQGAHAPIQSCFENVWKIFRKADLKDNANLWMKIIYPATLHAIGLHRGCFAGSFSKPFKQLFYGIPIIYCF